MDAAVLEELLSRFDAADDDRAWCQGRTLAEAWRASQSGYLLIRLAAAAGVDRRRVLRAVCACARLTLKYALVMDPQYDPLDQPSVPLALDVTEAWANCVPGVELDAVKAVAGPVEQAAYGVDCAAGYLQVPFPPGAVDVAFAVANAAAAAVEESEAEYARKVAKSVLSAVSAGAAQSDYSDAGRLEFDATVARSIRDFIRAEDVAAAATSRAG
ncbi:hypothetical protein KRR26_28840 [Corallococcus sp. M34]|uniref:hypothetical protein n=1 Tax=Citreicoccus inhibens TaxID=2849499 RepID=UPI001C229AB1|nr:hypothetical protein [Citreicoccus inhibens]MBU8899624.1 hypothetical protein [Citreicoccus inhibens]